MSQIFTFIYDLLSEGEGEGPLDIFRFFSSFSSIISLDIKVPIPIFVTY